MTDERLEEILSRATQSEQTTRALLPMAEAKALASELKALRAERTRLLAVLGDKANDGDIEYAYKVAGRVEMKAEAVAILRDGAIAEIREASDAYAEDRPEQAARPSVRGEAFENAADAVAALPDTTPAENKLEQSLTLA